MGITELEKATRPLQYRVKPITSALANFQKAFDAFHVATKQSSIATMPMVEVLLSMRRCPKCQRSVRSLPRHNRRHHCTDAA